MSHKVKKQALLIAYLLVWCGTVLLSCGCSDDCTTCPTCPEPEPIVDEVYDGRLYVSMLNGDAGMYVIDMATDSIIDSVMYFASFGTVDVSPDGKYVVVNAIGETWIYDAADMSLVHRIADFAMADFVRNGTALLGAYRLTSYLYSFPDCQLEWSSDSIRWAGYVYSDERDEVIGVKRPDTIYCYSFKTNKTVHTWLVPPDSGGSAMWRSDVNSAGTRFYGITDYPDRTEFFILDLERDSIISRFPLYTPLGYIKLNPKLNEVYVTDPGAVGWTLSPGTVYIFNAETGEYLEGISLYGYNPQIPEFPLDPHNMEITPDGNHLYIRTGDFKTYAGPLVRINTRTRRVEKLIYLGEELYADDMAIAPKP